MYWIVGFRQEARLRRIDHGLYWSSPGGMIPLTISFILGENYIQSGGFLQRQFSKNPDGNFKLNSGCQGFFLYRKDRGHSWHKCLKLPLRIRNDKAILAGKEPPLIPRSISLELESCKTCISRPQYSFQWHQSVQGFEKWDAETNSAWQKSGSWFCHPEPGPERVSEPNDSGISILISGHLIPDPRLGSRVLHLLSFQLDPWNPFYFRSFVNRRKRIKLLPLMIAIVKQDSFKPKMGRRRTPPKSPPKKPPKRSAP